MPQDYLSVLKPFVEQTFDAMNPPSSKWRVNAFRFARSLLRLMDNPDAIYQSCFGLCGQVAFLRAWAYRDPVAVATFAMQLFREGSAKLGDCEVSASNDHLECSWMVLPLEPDPSIALSRWGVGNQISECVWMICGALAATACSSPEHSTLGFSLPPTFGSFDGQPTSDLSTLTLPSELKSWLELSACYGEVIDATDKVLGSSLEKDTFISSDFDASVDVFLCINANMLRHATISPPYTPPETVGFPFSSFPNHWVMLTEKVTRTDGLVTLKVWTWAGFYTWQLTEDAFDDDYFGSIVARASTPRRALNAGTLWNPLAAPRIYYNQTNMLCFQWSQPLGNHEWCELNRVSPNHVIAPDGFTRVRPRDTLQRVWAKDQRNVLVTLPMQDPAFPHETTYEIAACRGDLRPNDCDSFSYHGYDQVQCNNPQHYTYSPALTPLCETDTKHLRLRYVGYRGPNHIPDPLDPYTLVSTVRPDVTLYFGNEPIGVCLKDGSTQVKVNGAMLVVGTEARTPLSIQKLVVWFEYFCHLFESGALKLQCVKATARITITVGDVSYARIDEQSGAGSIGIVLPATDEELPHECLRLLLRLEKAKAKVLPDWVFPVYASRVRVVQAPDTSIVPVGFGSFGNAFRACETTTVYSAGWLTVRAGRALNVDIDKPLNPLRPAFVFFELTNKNMVEGSVKLLLAGALQTGQIINTSITLRSSADRAFHWGVFQPSNSSNNDYNLSLSIDGTRALPCDVLAALLGTGFDCAPSSPANPELIAPGAFAIVGYEPGVDRNHRVEVGPQARYARIAALTPDLFEPNNSFASATVASLIVSAAPNPSVPSSVEKVFERLNFHDEHDADYFDVSYQCPSHDDTDEANRDAFASHSTNLGLSYNHTPPALVCKVMPDDYRCMDLALYKYDANAPILIASASKSQSIGVSSPSRKLGTKRCYFVLTSHDPTSAGAFSYSARFVYTSAYVEATVDTNARAYGAQGSIRRRILERLYDCLDLPRPGDDLGHAIRVQDIASFIDGYSRFLREPEIRVLLSKTLQRNGAEVVAEGLHSVGQLAHYCGRVESARSLFRESATSIRAHESQRARVRRNHR